MKFFENSTFNMNLHTECECMDMWQSIFWDHGRNSYYYLAVIMALTFDSPVEIRRCGKKAIWLLWWGVCSTMTFRRDFHVSFSIDAFHIISGSLTILLLFNERQVKIPPFFFSLGGSQAPQPNSTRTQKYYTFYYGLLRPLLSKVVFLYGDVKKYSCALFL